MEVPATPEYGLCVLYVFVQPFSWKDLPLVKWHIRWFCERMLYSNPMKSVLNCNFARIIYFNRTNGRESNKQTVECRLYCGKFIVNQYFTFNSFSQWIWYWIGAHRFNAHIQLTRRWFSLTQNFKRMKKCQNNELNSILASQSLNGSRCICLTLPNTFHMLYALSSMVCGPYIRIP